MLYALNPHALFVLSSMRLSVQTIHLHGVKGSGQWGGKGVIAKELDLTTGSAISYRSLGNKW